MHFSKPKYFLLKIFLILFIFIVSYSVFYNYLIVKNSLGNSSYKDFLLKSTRNLEKPRIIIESGSNSLHSINSSMIEKEFNRIVLNISDNANIPLFYKLMKIKKYSKSGDIILLPLGYTHYYSTSTFPKYFYDHLFGEFKSYYDALNFIEKSKLIFKTPISSPIKSMEKTVLKIDNTSHFIDMFNSGDRGDLKFIQRSPLDFYTQNKSCEEYIFIRSINKKFIYDTYNFTISTNFRDNIKLMLEMEKEKNIKFILTYPAVAGDHCYDGKYQNKFIQFNQELLDFLDEQNIPMIGEYQDSYFEKEHMNDTYYHVLPPARDIRTKKLIKNIQESKIYSLFKNTSTKKKVKLSKSKLLNESLNSIQFNHEYVIPGNELLLLYGWHNEEKWGVWSKGDSSKIIFKIDKDQIQEFVILKIKSKLFASRDKTDISVNGNKIGSYLLEGTNEIKIDKKFMNRDRTVIELKYKNVQSPKDLDISSDERKIKLGLESIQVNTSTIYDKI